jgi:hypothetical protein
MNNSLKSRVFWTNLQAWNNRWYAYVGAPLFAALGAIIGSVLAAQLHSGELSTTLLTGGCMVVTMLVGFTLLAVVDRQ